MRHSILAGLVLGAALIAGSAGQSPAGQYISIATSSAGGTMAIIGTAMADVINRTVPDVNANIEITGGTSENILLVAQKSTEVGIVTSDSLYLALNGQGSFEGKKVEGIMGVMGGHLTSLQVYVLADSPYRSFSDLRGKRISIGPAGSQGNDAMNTVMKAYGMEMNKDWTPEYLAHGDGAEALTDGNVDAVCMVSVVPSVPIASAAATKPIRLLNLDQKEYDKILAECKYYVPSRIPKETYRGMDADVDRSVACAALTICPDTLSEELVYNMVKATYSNLDELIKAYPPCEEWNPDNAYRGLEGLIAIHPGTVRYLKEIGKAK